MRLRRVCVALILALMVAVPSFAETARGVVFEDRDGDGRRNEGEPGVEGVSVSNGRDVVRTNAAGEYAVAVENGTIIFVTKPNGYAVPLNDDNLPQHYYIHYPEGTPSELGLRYPGVEPTGPLPESVDFPLVASDEPDRFNVIWFADTQPQTVAEIGYVRDEIVAELIGVDAAFGLTAGDIHYDDLSMIPRLTRVISQIGIPWHNIPGNHDLNFLVPDNRYTRETFKRYFGPTYYSFDYGRAHFVILDDIHYLGEGVGREEPHPRGVGTYEGRIDERQIAWLANDLEYVPEDRLVIVGMHIPIRSAMHPTQPGFNVLDRAGLFDALEGRKHVLIVAGHTHTAEHDYLTEDDGWNGEEPLHQHVMATVSGSWWSGPFDDRGVPTTWQRDGSPNGYYVMTVDGNRATLRFKAAGEPADYQMRIVLDSAFHRFSPDAKRDYRMGELLGTVIHQDEVYATEVVVNLFDGGPRSTVEYTVGDRAPVKMRRDLRADPFFEELFARYADTMKSFVWVEPSTHIWVERLPSDLGSGVHTLTVRATDEYGQEHVAHKVFEVVRH